MPKRKFPGAVIQGDSLSSIYSGLLDILEKTENKIEFRQSTGVKANWHLLASPQTVILRARDEPFQTKMSLGMHETANYENQHFVSSGSSKKGLSRARGATKISSVEILSARLSLLGRPRAGSLFRELLFSLEKTTGFVRCYRFVSTKLVLCPWPAL